MMLIAKPTSQVLQPLFFSYFIILIPVFYSMPYIFVLMSKWAQLFLGVLCCWDHTRTDFKILSNCRDCRNTDFIQDSPEEEKQVDKNKSDFIK